MTGAVGRVGAIVVDCRDSAALATFWAAVLGGELAVPDSTWATVRDPATGATLAFQQVPEAKSGKNRLHFDIEVADLDEATKACLRLGATSLGLVVQDEDGSFQVMLDPEGNEFCLVR